MEGAQEAPAPEGGKKKRGRGRKGNAGGNMAIRKAQQESKANFLFDFLTDKYRGRVRSACLQLIADFVAFLPAEVILK